MAKKQTFLDTVLNWSIADILNERLFDDKVLPIPLRFRNREEYCDAFKWPQLEDTRARLQQRLETLGSRAYIPLHFVLEEPEREDEGSGLKTLSLLVEETRNFVKRDDSHAPWTPRNTDLPILANAVPKSWEDLQRIAGSYSFVQVVSSGYVKSSADDVSFSIKVKASVSAASPHYPNLYEEQTSCFLVFLENVATRLNMWDALRPHLLDNASNRIAEEILCSGMQGSTSKLRAFDSFQENEGKLETTIGKYCSYRGLNLSHTKAITDALTSVIRRTGQRVKLIQGPPGTGCARLQFFADSGFDTKWRVLYSAMAESHNSEVLRGKSTAFPQFDDQKHRLLMSKLKQLYVVVTRARQRLWVYDEAHHEPMLDYWRSSGTISVQKLNDEFLKSIHEVSTPENWKRRGLEFLRDKQYDMAEISFSRAGDADLATYAKALAMQRAREVSFVASKTFAEQNFRDAAEIFISLAKHDMAAKCYMKSGDYKSAGEVYRDKCEPAQLEDAANCFLRGKLWGEAAQVSRFFSLELCVTACWQGKLLAVGLEVLQEWEVACSSANKTKSSGNRQSEVTSSCSREEFEKLKMMFLRNCALHYDGQEKVDGREGEALPKLSRVLTQENLLIPGSALAMKMKTWTSDRLLYMWRMWRIEMLISVNRLVLVSGRPASDLVKLFLQT